jgi:xanthine dehydrogenase small subunit
MVRFTLNGSPVTIDEVDPHTSLLSWLRSRGMTGTKEGCAEGECGACAVAVLRADSHGQARYEALNSCLLPLPSAAGRSIVTVEGVAAGDALHPVQQAMVERGGSQCGYCTPGFVVSLFCEFYRPGRGDYDPEAISGNLCRCTGYRPIIDVARELPPPSAGDPRLPILREPVPAVGSLSCKSNAGAFTRPTSLPELFDAWDANPDATLIAGGTDLMVYANQRYRRWPTFLSLEALPELRGFALGERELTIGAGFELAALEERLREHAGLLPVLEQLLPLFSSRLIRNRATLGGSLGTASPIGDAAPVLLALDAELTLTSRAGRRRIPLRDFFAGYRKTQLAARELIESVHIALPAPPLQQFYKVSKRVLDDISTVAAAFTLTLDQGRVVQLRAAYGGIAATPLRAFALESAAAEQLWNEDTIAALLPSLRELGTPQTDQRGSAAYREAMIGKLFAKFYADTARAA